MSSRLGFPVFAVGVAIAVTGGAKAPADGASWPDTILIFGIGVGIAIIGLILWWMSERSAQPSADQHGTDHDEVNPIEAFIGLHADLDRLSEQSKNSSLDDLLSAVEGVQSQRIYGIVESKQRINNELGMSEAAEILIAFAYCERMLNRVWSAAADGHRTEALTALEDALNTSEQIAERLRRHSGMEMSE